MKTVLIIAGSDPGAGAGLQQDLKVATLMGAYGLTVVTALTVQNSLGVTAVHPVAPEVVAAQLDAVLSDFPVAAVKVGMLATPALVHTVAEKLKGLDAPLVLDPVLAAGGGFPLLEEAGIAILKDELFPLTFLLTPNAPEAARLTGLTVQTPADLEEAARRLQALGPPLGPGQRRPPAGGAGGRAHRRQQRLPPPRRAPGRAAITTAPAASWPRPAPPAWPRGYRCRKR